MDLHPDKQELDTRLMPLLQHLKLVQERSLWIVIVPAISFQRYVSEYLITHLKETHSVTELIYSSHSLSLAEKLRVLPDTVQNQAIAFIYDLDKLDSPERKKAVELLNRGREILANAPYSVVLFVLPDTAAKIIHKAGDFWAWRSGVSDLSKMNAELADAGEYTALRQRYIKAVIDQHSYLQMPGSLSKKMTYLEEIFVPIDKLWLATEITPGMNFTQDINILPLTDALRTHSKVVLLGEPGSGKSVLLRYLLLTFAKGKQVVQDRLGITEERIPVLLPLRLFGEALTNNDAKDFPGFLSYFFEIMGLRGFDRLVIDQLEMGKCLILLDGLDEISAMPLRRRVAESLTTLTRQYPDNRYIVTSRLAGYSFITFEQDFAQFLVPELRLDQIKTYVENWLGFTKEQLNTERLFNIIQMNPELLKLASNPLLLSLILLSYYSYKSIALQRVKLYEGIVRSLLETWDIQRGIISFPLPLYEALEITAYWLCENRPDGSASYAELLNLVRNHVAFQPVSDKIEKLAGKTLETIINRTGLLVEIGTDEYRFSYPFLEYFAARNMCLNRNAGQEIRKHLHKPRWTEPIKLAVAIVTDSDFRKSEQLTEMITQARSPYEDILHRDLLLAAQCLASVEKVSRGLSKKILPELLDLFFDLEDYGPSRLLLNQIIKTFSDFQGSYLYEMEIEPALLKGLQDHDARIRLRSVQALGEIGSVSQRLVYLLTESLEDKDARVRSGAANTLVKLGQQAVLPLLDSLQNKNVSIRETVAIALGQISGEEAIQGLLTLLADNAWPVRAIAAAALEFAGEKALTGLEKALKDKAWEVRANAASSLGMIAHPGSEAALLEASFDSNAYVRESVTSALGKVGKHQAVKRLVELLEDPVSSVAGAAVTALGNLGDAETVPILRRKLTDNNEAVSQNTAVALQRLLASDTDQKNLIRQLRAANPDSESSLAMAAARMGLREKWIHHALIKQLKSSEPRTQVNAAELLWQFGQADDLTVNSLLALLNNNISMVRSSAIAALSRLSPEKTHVVLSLLARLEDDSDPLVRAVSVLATGRLKGHTPQRVKALTRTLSDSSPLVRARTAEVLTSICINDDTVTPDHALQTCELLAIYLSKSGSAMNNSSHDIAYESLSRLVEYLTETEQLSAQTLDNFRERVGISATVNFQVNDIPPEKIIPEKRDMRALRETLIKYFDTEELEILCSDLDVDYKILSGTDKSDKSSYLINYLQRKGRLDELIGYINTRV